MQEIINILMRRDGITREEAIEVIENCQIELKDAIIQGASYDTVADIIAYWLGLEPDYMEYLI